MVHRRISGISDREGNIMRWVNLGMITPENI
jgi:hypothetical protein